MAVPSVSGVVARPALPAGPARAAETPGVSAFSSELTRSLSAVNGLQHEAENAMSAAASRGASAIHETMLKLEEADIGLRLLVRVRNKALDAYQEIMRMQF